MKKLLIGGFLFLASITSAFAASQSVTLSPGWNTFSTPKLVSGVSFSNGNGSGLFFYQLSGSGWISVVPNPTNIQPLEGFVVNNTNTGSVSVNLEYRTGLTPSEMLFQKTLHAGWNFVGITTDSNPFGSIGSGTTMSVDFTRKTDGSNLTNAVNSSFSTTSGNANILNPELTEAYAIFAPSSTLYAGNQDQAISLSMTRTDGLGNPTTTAGATNVVVYGAQISTTQNNPIQLTNLQATIGGTASTNQNVAYTLYVNGIAKSTKTQQTSTVSFDNFNISISNSQAVDIQIKADINNAVTTGNFNIASVSYVAVDSITSNNITPISVAGAVFTINEAIGTLAATTGDTLVNKSLLLAGATTQKITSFKVTATNDTIKIKTIVLTGANLDNLSNIRLQDINGDMIAASSATPTGATFANVDTAINFANAISINTSKTYYIVADVNSTTDATGIYANVIITGSEITSSNGTIITMIGANVAGASHDIAQNTFKVTQSTPVGKNIATDAMEFTMYAFGGNGITLTNATFDNTLSGYTGSMVLTVVRKSDNAAVGTLSATTGVVTFSSNNYIDAGTSTTYVVKIDGALIDGGSPSQNWTVSLTHLNINTGANTFDAASYSRNIDTLPLTSNK